MSDLPVLGFADRAAFEAWLADQGPTSRGAWIKLAKAGATTLGKAEAIDAALCHGWIDGQIAKGADDTHLLTRFTPRTARSRWSDVARRTGNDRLGARRWGAGRRLYPSASTAGLPADFAEALDAESGARDFFDTLTGANRYAILYRVHQARTEKLRNLRIAEFVALCAAGRTIHGPKVKASATVPG